ncbi:MAG: type II toxin-antitoxin system VapC family toxin [Gammaproteobacteria bacterium]|nr:type II toxin-antitoxin system VapC family toxin [Gammaproteobacteria bacterium]
MRPTERLVLDTSAYSHLRAGHVQVLDHVADAAVVVIPVTVLGELEAGFELGHRTQENRRILAEFLDEPFTSVLDVTATTVRYYARIIASLRRAGTPIPVNDAWIAASAMECNGHLLTFDRDYRRIIDLDHTLLEAQ